MAHHVTTRRILLSLVLPLVLPLVFGGCGSDTAGPGGGATNFQGTWTVEGVVTAKNTCERELDDVEQWEISIAQNGSDAWLSFGNRPLELSISGSTATTSFMEDNSTIDVSITVSGNDLTGSINAERSTGPNPCTEVFSLTGTRVADPPSADFAGSWDLLTDVTSSFCDGVDVGELESICREIEVDGSAISIDDSDGVIFGVINGTSAVLWRLGAEEELTVELNLAGGLLSGNVSEQDLLEDCRVNSTISGTPRQEACPPPPEPSEFAGSWHPDVFQTSTSGCGLVDPDEQYFGPCLSVTVNGTTVSVDDGSGLGILNGSIEKDAVVVSRNEGDGIYELRLELNQEGLSGTSSKFYTSGQCSGGDLQFQFDGIRLPMACNAAGGPFDGSWNLQIQFTTNECQFPSPEPECAEMYQNGNLVFVDGAFLQGDQATAIGNTLTLHEETSLDDTMFILDTQLQVDAGGNTLTGTQTLTIESSGSSCTSSADIVGTRTSGCN